jgi:hypothetical protein
MVSKPLAQGSQVAPGGVLPLLLPPKDSTDHEIFIHILVEHRHSLCQEFLTLKLRHVNQQECIVM